MSWLLLVIGAIVAALGTTVAVSTAVVRSGELARWVSQRLRGAAVASVLLSSQGRTLAMANAFQSMGALLAGIALAGLFTGMPEVVTVTAGVIVAVPLLVGVVYAVPRAVGKRWPQFIFQALGRPMESLGKALSFLLPNPTVGTDSDLSVALKSGKTRDAMPGADLAILRGVTSFMERPIREVMTPRTDIVAVVEGTPLAELAQVFVESGYSRIPIYRDSLDNIIGFTHAFDLLQVSPGDQLPLRTASTFPFSKPSAQALFEMQRERRQFGVVLDEFGGTAGIATFEDLLGEFVIDIFREIESGVTEAELPQLVEVSGSTACEELGAKLGVLLPDRTATVGGLLSQASGKIPQAGERYSLGELEFDVLEATPTRVLRVVVRRGPSWTRDLTP